MGICTRICLAPKWVLFPLDFTASPRTGSLQGLASPWHPYSRGKRCVGQREQSTLQGLLRSAPSWKQAGGRACHFWQMTATLSCADIIILNRLHSLSCTPQSVVCYWYQFNLYVKTQSVSFALRETWQKKKGQIAGRMFPSCGMDHRKLDSWSILIGISGRNWGKRELHAEAPFVLFFGIVCLRWSEAIGGWLPMKYASPSIKASDWQRMHLGGATELAEAPKFHLEVINLFLSWSEGAHFR